MSQDQVTLVVIVIVGFLLLCMLFSGSKSSSSEPRIEISSDPQGEWGHSDDGVTSDESAAISRVMEKHGVTPDIYDSKYDEIREGWLYRNKPGYLDDIRTELDRIEEPRRIHYPD